MTAASHHAGDALSALLDGELVPAEAVLVDGHLTRCAACTSELKDVAHVRHLVRSLPAVAPPEHLFTGMLEAASRRARLRRRTVSAVAVAASAGAVLTVAPSGEEPELPPAQVVRVESPSVPVAYDPLNSPVVVPVTAGR